MFISKVGPEVIDCMEKFNVFEGCGDVVDGVLVWVPYVTEWEVGGWIVVDARVKDNWHGR